jgi:DNA-binding NtrC family response regulator
VKLQARAVARTDLIRDGLDIVELSIGYGRTLDQWAMNVAEAKDLVLTLQQAIAVFEPVDLGEPLMLDMDAVAPPDPPEPPIKVLASPPRPSVLVLPPMRSEVQPFKEAKREIVERWERQYLDDLARRCGGNKSAMARAAGIERAYLCHKVKELGVRDAYDEEEGRDGIGDGVDQSAR